VKVTYDFECNLAQTLNIVGDRWTLLVLHRIYIGKNTFKELQQTLESIPSNILSSRLKILEKNGMIKSELYSEHPPRYQYIITDKGREFKHVFNSIMLWSTKYIDSCKRTIVHNQCGAEVEIKYYCKNCNEIIDDIEVK